LGSRLQTSGYDSNPAVLVWGPASPGPSAPIGGTPDILLSDVSFQVTPKAPMPRMILLAAKKESNKHSLSSVVKELVMEFECSLPSSQKLTIGYNLTPV
jgi:hypothetical protein